MAAGENVGRRRQAGKDRNRGVQAEGLFDALGKELQLGQVRVGGGAVACGVGPSKRVDTKGVVGLMARRRKTC